MRFTLPPRDKERTRLMPTNSSAEQTEIIIRQFIEAIINPRNSAAFDELYDPHFVNHDTAPGASVGIEGLRQHYRLFRAAFPDYWETIDSIISRGDTLVVRSTMYGTHRGAWKGILPTGRRVRATRLRILRIVNGKIAEGWGSIEPVGLMQQLGAIPPRGQSWRAQHRPNWTAADARYL